MTELSIDKRQEHWRRTRNLTITHLAVWFVFGYLVHWFASALHGINFFGWPLNYYMAAQGALAVFVIQLFMFNHQQHKIDVEFGVAEEQE